MEKDKKIRLLYTGGLLTVIWLIYSLITTDGGGILLSVLCIIIFLSVIASNPTKQNDSEIAIVEIATHLTKLYEMSQGDAMNRATKLVIKMGPNGARYHVFQNKEK